MRGEAERVEDRVLELEVRLGGGRGHGGGAVVHLGGGRAGDGGEGYVVRLCVRGFAAGAGAGHCGRGGALCVDGGGG